MFWPLVLPFQITCVVLTAAVLLLTIFATPGKWSRGASFVLYSLLAAVAFVPSCTCVMGVVDFVRFGDFEYANFEEVNGFRYRRYLPENATAIQMHKSPSGFSARYSIPPEELDAHLDRLWDQYGEYSTTQRNELENERFVTPREFEGTFGEMGWTCPAKAKKLRSPTEPDGGGAIYVIDDATGEVFQYTGFF